ncbi:MAG: DNA mismatch repair protein MutS [Candidatus Dormibacteria bacterium]
MTPSASAEAAPATARPAGDTPAVRQYWRVKEAHPDALVFFRLGDFFELFGEDASRAAPILGVALTARDFGRGGRLPMCGVPHHSLEGYARKLLERGLKVAVCDQVEPARAGRLVERRVVRVLSPGTLVEDAFLEAGASARCVALWVDDGRVGLAALDVSTGDCQLAVIAARPGSEALADQLVALDAAELLLPASAGSKERWEVPVTAFADEEFSAQRGRLLLEQAGAELDQDGAPALPALSALAAYCQQGQVSWPTGAIKVQWRRGTELMELDAATRRNLDLLPSGAATAPSLLRLLDRTRTAAGARHLRSWLLSPLRQPNEIELRQAAVAQLADDGPGRARLREALARCRDLERLLGRCSQGVAGPRDLSNVAATIEALPELIADISHSKSLRLREIAGELAVAPLELAQQLRAALVDPAPALAREGDFIRPGFDLELDRIRDEAGAARAFLSGLEGRERDRTGIRSLKVGYNRVFGYYLEVRNASAQSIPPEYQRRQTLVAAERYITPELKEQENVVLQARERAERRERRCLEELLEEVRRWAGPVAQVAGRLGDLDALQSLAEAMVEHGWVLPEIQEGTAMALEEGRHPLVEEALPAGEFVPNDLVVDGEHERIWLLTGPNMAGKSTFLRQVAVICLLGQIGSGVPCRRARWGLVDRIFTRVGAHDEIAAGRSTFLVEMQEMAAILKGAGPQSLLVLDEIGRGTSTYDGMSIARALLEHLHDDRSSARRVLFATHYHELTALEATLPALRNHRVEVLEESREGKARVTFLHRIVPGGADRSYGIHVAGLAGLPKMVVDRAQQILEQLESQRPLGAGAGREQGQQLALPLAPAHPLVGELEELRLEEMTPLQALQKLADWQRAARPAD